MRRPGILLTFPALRPLYSLLFLVLAGCGHPQVLEKITPPEDDAFAREFIFNLTRGGELERAFARLDPSLQNDTARAGLQSLEDLFGRGAVRKIEVIGVFFRAHADGSGARLRTELSYQLEMTTGWFVGMIALAGPESDRRVVHAIFNPSKGDLALLHRFDAPPLTPFRMVFLALCVAVPLFCVITLIACHRSRIRYRIVWLIAIALPVVGVKLDWTEGTVNVNPFGIVILGAAFSKAAAHAPWVFTIGLPVGAILFWANRRAESARPPPPPSITAGPPPPPSV